MLIETPFDSFQDVRYFIGIFFQRLFQATFVVRLRRETRLTIFIASIFLPEKQSGKMGAQFWDFLKIIFTKYIPKASSASISSSGDAKKSEILAFFVKN